MEKLLKASAWYAATYEYAAQLQASGYEGEIPTSFPWYIND
jgi:hypothetical protein